MFVLCSKLSNIDLEYRNRFECSNYNNLNTRSTFSTIYILYPLFYTLLNYIMYCQHEYVCILMYTSDIMDTVHRMETILLKMDPPAPNLSFGSRAPSWISLIQGRAHRAPKYKIIDITFKSEHSNTYRMQQF